MSAGETAGKLITGGYAGGNVGNIGGRKLEVDDVAAMGEPCKDVDG